MLSSTVKSIDDPRIGRLLDRLSHTALRTPGGEQALWLVVVPGSRTLAVFKPAEAAAAVAVATISGLEGLLEKVFEPRGQRVERASMDRLRIVGRLLPEQALQVLSSRVESAARIVGPGASQPSGFVAVALDAADRELHREPIACLSAARPVHFGLLFPVTAEVASVELRNETETLCTIRRTDASPLVRGPKQPGETAPTPPELRDDVLHWTYQHPRGVRSQAIVEVSRDGIWTPFASLDACRDAQALPLHRLQRIERVRIVASDGWNATEKEIGADINGRAPVIARRVSATAWWADVAPGWPFTWHAPGLPPRTTRLLEVAPGATGIVQLVAKEPKSGQTFTDRRALEEEESA